MSDKLTLQFPSQGWKQFLTARQDMLSAFDNAREKAKSHSVETYHGKVAEAQLRKWLSDFLPKKYGVTSGYIVSQGLKHTEKTPHFDVIIYNQLESPILWIDDYPDVSRQGRSQAIPAEYVYCVLEVKSSFSSRTVSEAIKHLKELQPLMSGLDDLTERYKLYFPPNFCCGLVFFELKQKHQSSETALQRLNEGVDLRGFFGGVILRGEGHVQEVTGKLSFLPSDTPIPSTFSREKKTTLLTYGNMAESVKIADDLYYSPTLFWAESFFAQFGFDLIAMMQGNYQVNRLSSFYGMGNSYQD